MMKPKTTLKQKLFLIRHSRSFFKIIATTMLAGSVAAFGIYKAFDESTVGQVKPPAPVETTQYTIDGIDMTWDSMEDLEKWIHENFTEEPGAVAWHIDGTDYVITEEQYNNWSTYTTKYYTGAKQDVDAHGVIEEILGLTVSTVDVFEDASGIATTDEDAARRSFLESKIKFYGSATAGAHDEGYDILANAESAFYNIEVNNIVHIPGTTAVNPTEDDYVANQMTADVATFMLSGITDGTDGLGVFYDQESGGPVPDVSGYVAKDSTDQCYVNTDLATWAPATNEECFKWYEKHAGFDLEPTYAEQRDTYINDNTVVGVDETWEYGGVNHKNEDYAKDAVLAYVKANTAQAEWFTTDSATWFDNQVDALANKTLNKDTTADNFTAGSKFADITGANFHTVYEADGIGYLFSSEVDGDTFKGSLTETIASIYYITDHKDLGVGTSVDELIAYLKDQDKIKTETVLK